MSVKFPHTEQDTIYFCTFTCCKWLPLFEKADCYDFIYGWLNRLINEGHQILGYVIMPNHLHLLLYVTGNSQGLNKIIGEGKRFMAYHIIKELTNRNEQGLLQQLSEAVERGEKLRGKKHEVFEPSFEAKQCYTLKFIEQKLNYIHTNPVSGKWNLAPTFLDYQHSSARFYELNEVALIKITHYRDAGVKFVAPSPPGLRKGFQE